MMKDAEAAKDLRRCLPGRGAGDNRRERLLRLTGGLGSWLLCRAIMENIRNLGLGLSLLKYVVSTHAHIDHIGGLHYSQLL